MEDLSFLTQKGWIGIGAWVFIKEVIPLWKKYVSGNYVSYKDLHEKLTEVTLEIKNHLVEEAKEDVRMGELTTRVTALEEKVETENGHLFKQNGSVFQKLDELNNKFDHKIDKIDEKIDARFLVINDDIKAILREMRK